MTKKLHKAKLKSIPFVEVSRFIYDQARRIDAVQYYMKAERITIDHQRILVINAYQREELLAGRTLPQIRIFMSKHDYISQRYIDGEYKWRTGRLESLVDYVKGYRYPNIICGDLASERVLRRFFSYLGNTERKMDDLINEAQYRIRQKRLQKKHQVIKDRIDLRMQQIKRMPMGFQKWVDEEALYDSRYIYYRYERKTIMDGYCTSCHSDVKVEKPIPEGLLWAIDALKAAKEDVLYVGDSIVDAKTAQNADVDFAAVLTGTTEREAFLEYPHVEIADNVTKIKASPIGG